VKPNGAPHCLPIAQLTYEVLNKGAFKAVKDRAHAFQAAEALKVCGWKEGRARTYADKNLGKADLEAMGLLPAVIRRTALVIKGDKEQIPPRFLLEGKADLERGIE
jgi:hypothetical protein